MNEKAGHLFSSPKGKLLHTGEAVGDGESGPFFFFLLADLPDIRFFLVSGSCTFLVLLGHLSPVCIQ